LRVGTARQAADLFAGLCLAFLRLLEAAAHISVLLHQTTPQVHAPHGKHRAQCSWPQKGALSTDCYTAAHK